MNKGNEKCFCPETVSFVLRIFPYILDKLYPFTLTRSCLLLFSQNRQFVKHLPDTVLILCCSYTYRSHLEETKSKAQKSNKYCFKRMPRPQEKAKEISLMKSNNRLFPSAFFHLLIKSSSFSILAMLESWRGTMGRVRGRVCGCLLLHALCGAFEEGRIGIPSRAQSHLCHIFKFFLLQSLYEWGSQSSTLSSFSY
jgi:hypothetical protein